MCKDAAIDSVCVDEMCALIVNEVRNAARALSARCGGVDLRLFNWCADGLGLGLGLWRIFQRFKEAQVPLFQDTTI